ncbi:MAG: CBM9, partial [uncultured Gemmatimonadetes bacterium]
ERGSIRYPGARRGVRLFRCLAGRRPRRCAGGHAQAPLRRAADRRRTADRRPARRRSVGRRARAFRLRAEGPGAGRPAHRPHRGALRVRRRRLVRGRADARRRPAIHPGPRHAARRGIPVRAPADFAGHLPGPAHGVHLRRHRVGGAAGLVPRQRQRTRARHVVQPGVERRGAGGHGGMDGGDAHSLQPASLQRPARAGVGHQPGPVGPLARGRRLLGGDPPRHAGVGLAVRRPGGHRRGAAGAADRTDAVRGGGGHPLRRGGPQRPAGGAAVRRHARGRRRPHRAGEQPDAGGHAEPRLRPGGGRPGRGEPERVRDLLSRAPPLLHRGAALPADGPARLLLLAPHRGRAACAREGRLRGLSPCQHHPGRGQAHRAHAAGAFRRRAGGADGRVRGALRGRGRRDPARGRGAAHGMGRLSRRAGVRARHVDRGGEPDGPAPRHGPGRADRLVPAAQRRQRRRRLEPALPRRRLRGARVRRSQRGGGRHGRHPPRADGAGPLLPAAGPRLCRAGPHAGNAGGIHGRHRHRAQQRAPLAVGGAGERHLAGLRRQRGRPHVRGRLRHRRRRSDLPRNHAAWSVPQLFVHRADAERVRLPGHPPPRRGARRGERHLEQLLAELRRGADGTAPVRCVGYAGRAAAGAGPFVASGGRPREPRLRALPLGRRRGHWRRRAGRARVGDRRRNWRHAGSQLAGVGGAAVRPRARAAAVRGQPVRRPRGHAGPALRLFVHRPQHPGRAGEAGVHHEPGPVAGIVRGTVRRQRPLQPLWRGAAAAL